MNHTLKLSLSRWQTAGIMIGGIGLLSCLAMAPAGANQCYSSYLFGYLCWLELSLGCLVIAMIHYLTGGRWGNVTRRFFEAGFMTLPLMALLFIPLCFGLKRLYPWAQPAIMVANKSLQNKAAYLNGPGFIIRAGVFFAIWITLAHFLRKWSLQQDVTADLAPTRRLRSLSGPGLVIHALVVTFAFIDWVMSLEPDWYSTMFAVIIFAGQILAAYSFSILLLAGFKKHLPLQGEAILAQFHQLGNLLLTFVMFWTYVMFGQFLINWAGNTPREIIWYQHRVAGGWKWIIAIILLFHFLLPFFLLLFRASKRRIPALAAVAIMVLVAHVAVMFWLVAPAFHQTGFSASWLDVAAFCGVGGIWFAAFITLLKRRPLLAHNDPRIEYAPS